jgi:predicted dehydrogenase
MWGFHRTSAKIINRLSLPLSPVLYLLPRNRDLLLVGCGQFGLSTASFFIGKKLGNRFLGCYDIDLNQASRAKSAYKYKFVAESFEALTDLEGAKYMLVASNHASHTSQTIVGLNKGLMVHVEKPISVSWDQLSSLSKVVKGKEDRLFVGYNRPFAKATQILRKHLPNGDGPFTIQYFIAGHAIDRSHWYYDPKEGTRICGNVGHWIDLTIHLLSQRDVADKWEITIVYSDLDLREENFSLSMKSDKGDLISMTFTTRGEPFDGVSETVNLQHGEVMAKIEDFQSIKLWKGSYFKNYKFRPKDVGHKSSVLQMFDDHPEYRRPWGEIYLSTMLMLHITDMVKSELTCSNFSFHEADLKVRSA